MPNGYPITDERSEYDDLNPYQNRDPRLAAYIMVNGAIKSVLLMEWKSPLPTMTMDLNKENGKSTKTGYYIRKLLRHDVNLNPNAKNAQKHCQRRIRTTEILLDYAEAANEAWGPKANVGAMLILPTM